MVDKDRAETPRNYEGWALLECGPRMIVGRIRTEHMFGMDCIRISFPDLHDPEKLVVQHIPCRMVTLIQELSVSDAGKYLAASKARAQQPDPTGPQLVQ